MKTTINCDALIQLQRWEDEKSSLISFYTKEIQKLESAIENIKIREEEQKRRLRTQKQELKHEIVELKFENGVYIERIKSLEKEMQFHKQENSSMERMERLLKVTSDPIFPKGKKGKNEDQAIR